MTSMTKLLPASLLVLLPITTLLAQTDETTAPAAPSAPSPIFWVCYFAVIILLIAAMWKVFSKAGQPGWAAIIPIYNFYVMCKIAGRPGWWVILMFIPLVNFIILIILMIDIAKSFGKGVGFGLGLVFLGIIFWPILGFGSAQYRGPAAGGAPAAA
jgi:hypothetical protein